MRARRFAEARGRLAKTDRLDARMLSELGARLQPPPEPAPSAKREQLAAFARRRDQLVEMRARQRRHLQEAFDTAIIADIESLIEHLDGRIAAI
ncbi:transposase [Phyllobacterium phragmitis]|uniref:Transposase IS110-like N-terminal domain-containing protein n=1 Tax=Phyllobacterium phragmitis TaxID=2670329 RepID=A0ABQ0GXZ1_9HYPH